MTPIEELDLLLKLIRKYDLPLSPILEYAVTEKKEEYTSVPVEEDCDEVYDDYILDEEYEDEILPKDSNARWFFQSALSCLVRQMDKRSYEILEATLKGESRKFIAQKYGLTQERIRQIVVKATKEAKELLIEQRKNLDETKAENARLNVQLNLLNEETLRLKTLLPKDTLLQKMSGEGNFDEELASLFETPLTDIRLSVRASNILQYMEIKKFADIPQIESVRKLWDMRNSGRKTVHEISKLLDDFHLTFGMSFTEMVNKLSTSDWQYAKRKWITGEVSNNEKKEYERSKAKDETLSSHSFYNKEKLNFSQKEEFKDTIYDDEHETDTIAETIVPESEAVYGLESSQEKSPKNKLDNNGLPWTREQKTYAIYHYKKGDSILLIANNLRRSEAAITGMLSRIGLLQNRDKDVASFQNEVSVEKIVSYDAFPDIQVLGIWDAYKNYELQNIFVSQLIAGGHRNSMVSSKLSHFRYKIKVTDEHEYYGERLRQCKSFYQCRRILEELFGTWKSEKRFSWRKQFFVDYLLFLKKRYDKYGRFLETNGIAPNKTKEETATIKLTRDIIEAARTPNGGFTKSQLAAIGIEWPPDQDWISKKVGAMITPSQLEAFNHIEYVAKKSADSRQEKKAKTYKDVSFNSEERRKMEAILQAMTHFMVPATPCDITRAISRTTWGGLIKEESVDTLLKRMPEVEYIQWGKYILKSKLNDQD